MYDLSDKQAFCSTLQKYIWICKWRLFGAKSELLSGCYARFAAVITERFHRRVAITTATLTLDDTYTNTETLEKKNKPSLNNVHELKLLCETHKEVIGEKWGAGSSAQRDSSTYPMSRTRQVLGRLGCKRKAVYLWGTKAVSFVHRHLRLAYCTVLYSSCTFIQWTAQHFFSSYFILFPNAFLNITTVLCRLLHEFQSSNYFLVIWGMGKQRKV